MKTKLSAFFKKVFRWSYKSILWFLAILVMIITITILLYWQSNLVAEMVESYINYSLADKGTIKYKKISGSLFNNIDIEGLEFELTDKMQIRSNKISLEYDLFALWNGKFKIASVTIDSISIKLIPGPHEEKERPAFNLDTLLVKIQQSRFVDTLLAKMPDLELDNFEISTGYFEIQDKNLTFEDIYLKTDALFKPDNFRLDILELSGHWIEKDLTLNNLEFQVLGNRDKLTINKFQFESGNSHFMLAGDIDLNSMNTILAVEDFNFDFNTLTGLVPGLKNAGTCSGKFALIGKPRDFAIEGNIKGSWKQHSLRQLQISAAYESGTIDVDTLMVKSNMGDIFLTANINPQKSAVGRLRVNNFNLHNIDTSFAQSRINSNVTFRFPSGAFDVNHIAKSIKNITGTGSIILNNSYYDKYNVDSLRFAIRANRGDISIEQPSFLQFADQARFDIYGDLKRDQNLNLLVQTDVGDLNGLTSALGLDSLYGLYYSDFKAYGKLTDPNIQGYLWIDKLKYDKVLLDSIGLDFQVSNIISHPIGAANFNIQRGNVYNIPVRDASLNASIDSVAINVSNARIFSEDNYIETTLNIMPAEDSTRIAINYLRMEYESYWLKNEDQINVTIDSSRVNIKSFNLTGPGNTFVKLDGFYAKKQNDVFANINLQSLNIQPFQQFLGKQNKADGILSGRAELKSLLTEPEIVVDIQGQDILFRDVAFGDFKIDLQYDKKKIFVRTFDWQVDSTKLVVEGDLAFDFDKNIGEIFDLIKRTQTNLSIYLSNVNLQNFNALFPMDSPIYGELNGKLELEGTVNDPYMRQSLHVDNFSFKNYKIDSLVMFAQYSAGYIILDSLSANFNGTDFSLKGYQQLDLGLEGNDSTLMDNPFEFYLTSKGEHMDFIGLFNSQIESIDGPYDLQLTFSGTPESPVISSGSIKMEDGTMLLSRVKDPVKNLDVDITVENNLLTINTLEARSQQEQDLLQKAFSFVRKLWSWMLPKQKPTGTIAVEGTINLENLFKPGVDIQIAMNEFYADYFVESTKISLTTENLAIKGKDTYTITGLLTIPYGEYEVNVEQAQKNMYLSDAKENKDSPGIAMELEIEIPGNFVVASSALELQNNFKVSLRGNLVATIAEGSDQMSLIGVLETESGKFTSFNQSFNVTSGEINFTDPLTINPEIHIVAQKQLRDKLFELVISGNLESIQQNIIVYDENKRELNLSPQDKIALLTFGADMSMVSANADSTFRGVGEDVATNVVLTAAERGVEELTGFDRVEISSSDKLLDLQKMKLNNGLKQASIAFGKYLTSDLYVEYRTQFGSGVPTPKLSWDAGNKITLEYRINKNWSVDSNYEKTIPLGNNKIQLGLSWEYTF